MTSTLCTFLCFFLILFFIFHFNFLLQIKQVADTWHKIMKLYDILFVCVYDILQQQKKILIFLTQAH